MSSIELSKSLWEEEVLKELPETLSEKAKELGAYVREREISSASELLRGLLGYVLSKSSLRAWGAWSVLMAIADISAQAWSKRLQKSEGWLEWLFNEFLATQELSCEPEWSQKAKRILLIDATRLKEMGGSGDDWRLHLAYDLLKAQMQQLVLSDQHQGESLSHFGFKEGDIVVADRAYGNRLSMIRLKEAGADGICRTALDRCVVYDAQAQRVDVLKWLRGLKVEQSVGELEVYCHGDQGEVSAVRVIACRLPQEQADLARKGLKDRRRKKGKSVSKLQLEMAGWVLILTTLSADEFEARAILRLYRGRWQIELVFKRIKQLLRMHQINATRPDSVKSRIWALLIAWLLQDQHAAEFRQLLHTSIEAVDTTVIAWPTNAPLSHWTLNVLATKHLRHIILGFWTKARFMACLPVLSRFFVTKQRNRIHQETQLLLWLERSFLSTCSHSPSLQEVA